MDPQAKRIAAARRCPNNVLLTYRDAERIAKELDSAGGQGYMLRAEALAEIAGLKTQVRALKARLAQRERLLKNAQPDAQGQVRKVRRRLHQAAGG